MSPGEHDDLSINESSKYLPGTSSSSSSAISSLTAFMSIAAKCIKKKTNESKENSADLCK